MEKDAGNCLAYNPRFYFDHETKSCKRFIYGGCGGNANRFVSRSECMDRCTGAWLDPVDPEYPNCKMAPKTGPCKARIPRFYFDQKLMDCKKFIYGGCEGNGNRYETYEDCMDTCDKTPDETE